MNEKIEEKPKKLFVSHSKKDIGYVEAIVELLEHIGVPQDDIFCSSIPGYDVPLDENILENIRSIFLENNVYVLFVLSNNYYKSPFCMAELGATWILQKSYTSILLPGFDFEDMKQLNPMKKSIKLDVDTVELKARLNELKNKLRAVFEVKASINSENRWEQHRDRFIQEINSVNICWGELKRLRDEGASYREWIPPLQRIVEKEPMNDEAFYLLGIAYAKIGDEEQAIKNLKIVENKTQNQELRKNAKMKLKEFGYSM